METQTLEKPIRKKYSTINEDIRKNWLEEARLIRLPYNAIKPDIRLHYNPHDKKGFTYGTIFNPWRENRLTVELDSSLPYDCPLCNILEINKNKRKIIPNNLENFTITINEFPVNESMSLVIHNSKGTNHIPMYSTSNLEGLSEELEKLLNFSNKYGFKLFHNSNGLGASIPRHEHWHFTNYGEIYDRIGRLYGFDEAEKVPTKKDKSVLIMPTFPFSHAIFQKEDVDKIQNYLKNVHNKLGNKFEDGNVPHTISQGIDGILITIGKNLNGESIGGGDIAGHIPISDLNEFENMTYEKCDKKLRGRLFLKEEVNLEALL